MTNASPSPELLEFRSRSRRRWLLGAVAGAATLGGVGVAWRAYQPKVLAPAAEEAIWALELPQPGGGTLSMAALRGKPLLLNFWATWCPPCVAELPLLSAFYRENEGKGWQVVGLAVDQLNPVKRFLTQFPVSFPVAMAGVPGMELGKTLGNLSGALPFTVVLGSEGVVAQRKMGKVSPEDLQSWTRLK